MKVPFSTPFEMTTSLPVGEVVARLRAAVYGQSVSYRQFRMAPVAGFIRDWSCSIHLRKGVFKNSINWYRVLYLQFFEVPEGTLLRGRFRMSWAFWVGIAASVLILIVLMSHGGRDWVGETGVSWYFAYLWMALMILGSVMPIWWSRRAEPKLEQFVREL
jgi:hypothetical protein